MSTKLTPTQMLEDILTSATKDVVLTKSGEPGNTKFKVTKNLVAGQTFFGEGPTVELAIQDLFEKTDAVAVLSHVGQ